MDILLQLTKTLKPLRHHHFILAVSGGLDSMALYEIFLHFKKHFDFKFSVVHFHHGITQDAEQLAFRFKAYEFVRLRCVEDEISFASNYDGEDKKSFLSERSQELKSENDCRDARYSFCRSLKVSGDLDLLVLAHHQDDLLETRLIRMIRGVGPEGLLSMDFQTGDLLRPLLNFTRSELKSFMTERGRSWIEDPSNQKSQALRNWIRNSWLKDLEERQPGALKSLARSLDLLLTQGRTSEDYTCCFDGNSIILAELLTLSPEGKKQAVASYMKSQGLKNYGHSHVMEVLKRLDSSQKRHTFNLLGCRWTVDAGRMSQEGLD